MGRQNIRNTPNPVIRAGMGAGVIYNRDPTRPIYIGRDDSVHASDTQSILDPLSSLYVGGDTDIWAVADPDVTAENPVSVDFIHSGRSQHHESPRVLSAHFDGLGTQLTETNQLLNNLIECCKQLQPGNGGGNGSAVIWGYQALFDGNIQDASDDHDLITYFNNNPPVVPDNCDLAMITFWLNVDSGSAITSQIAFYGDMGAGNRVFGQFKWPGGEQEAWQEFTFTMDVSPGETLRMEAFFNTNVGTTGNQVWIIESGMGITFMKATAESNKVE